MKAHDGAALPCKRSVKDQKQVLCESRVQYCPDWVHFGGRGGWVKADADVIVENQGFASWASVAKFGGSIVMKYSGNMV